MSSRKLISHSSSSEEDENRYAKIIDEKKRKRMISNRESARRSRMKKEQHIKDLNDQVTYFRTRSSEMAQKIDETERRYMAVESENRILRMQAEELKKRLELMEQVLVSYQSSGCHDVSDDQMGNSDEFSVMEYLQDPLLKPWLQPSFQFQTVDGIYQF
ncbi:bZIP transcription factor 53 [Sesamum alatum]|uniref:BZIP transcription factor 53 n=1 Tax=Sesamum alatum TaxID=300844 RepID=A0AAE2CL51_9LAMI|nr:bZIP transcription factor 53 [Sesamum alatum]